MKIEHIFICGLLAAIALTGCSYGNGNLNGMVIPDEGSTELAQVAESGMANAPSISFSAGDEDVLPPTQPPITTPSPTQSVEPFVTAAPTPKATPKPIVPPNATVKPDPAITPSPVPTVIPAPVATPIPTPAAIITPIVWNADISDPAGTPAPMPKTTPIPTPTPVPTPIVVMPAPEPPVARTICNICGADITGNVPAHGDSHLLNGEDFSYRVE